MDEKIEIKSKSQARRIESQPNVMCENCQILEAKVRELERRVAQAANV